MQVDPVLLYEFTTWANGRVLEGAHQLPEATLNAPIRPEWLSPLGVLVHIMAAERVWLSRWQGNSPKSLLTVKDVPTLAALEQAWEPLRREMREYLATLSDADRELVYYTTKGDEYRNVLWHLIMHVINHGTEHRSQVALVLAMNGVDVGGLDFSYYVRDVHRPM